MNKEALIRGIKKRRIDIIVIASLLLLSILTLLIVKLSRDEGATLTVTIDGVTVGEYPLDKDGVYTLGGGTNVLTVKDGKASMTYSTCPDHICERKRGVHYVGQQIVCLPNRLTVTVTGESDDAVDCVS